MCKSNVHYTLTIISHVLAHEEDTSNCTQNTWNNLSCNKIRIGANLSIIKIRHTNSIYSIHKCAYNFAIDILEEFLIKQIITDSIQMISNKVRDLYLLYEIIN